MTRRVALGAYAAVTAATVAWVAAVPGDPSFADDGAGSLGAAIAIGAAIVLLLAVGRAFGWWLAAVLDVVGLTSAVVMAITDAQPQALGVAALEAAALVVLLRTPLAPRRSAT